jgi:hypothetical protein
MGEESRQPRRLIPLAIAVSHAVVAIFEIGVARCLSTGLPLLGGCPSAAHRQYSSRETRR